MKKIQMVDLINQYQAIESEVQGAIQDVCANAQFINGPAVNGFREDL